MVLGLLIALASLVESIGYRFLGSVVAQGFSCSMTCGILVPTPGIELVSLHCKTDS